jgi:hypothetical protein
MSEQLELPPLRRHEVWLPSPLLSTVRDDVREVVGGAKRRYHGIRLPGLPLVREGEQLLVRAPTAGCEGHHFDIRPQLTRQHAGKPLFEIRDAGAGEK